MSGIRIADSGIVMISAKGGTSVGSEKAIRLLKKRDVPFLFFINRMDEPNADFEGVVSRMQERYGPCYSLSLPMMSGGEMTGIVDVMNKKAFSIDAKTGALSEIPLPEEYIDRIEELQNSVNEVIAEADDKLMEKFSQARHSQRMSSDTAFMLDSEMVNYTQFIAVLRIRIGALTSC